MITPLTPPPAPPPAAAATPTRGTCNFSYAPQHSYSALDLSPLTRSILPCDTLQLARQLRHLVVVDDS